ncbi:MAG: nitronate monooxygenase [Deltaproteobacteria bacterium]|nr:nitronate monooxygenase [Deltaproteobacteria bacterium]
MSAHPLHTRLCDLLGMRLPIIQTGMGWVATPELVAGACNAGAFGFLAAAALPLDEVEKRIVSTKELTSQPFGVNFLMDAPGAKEISEMILAHDVRAAGYNRAPSAELIDRLKAGGVVCVPTCGAPRHVQKAEKLGADAVIVQGGEGGGHTGTIPTTLQVPACVDAVEIPVIAAGGFKDGRGLVAALALGAEGIAMGTRFLMTAESPVPDVTTERYVRAGLTDVIVTREIDGMPQRVIVNELVAALESSGPLKRLLLAVRSGLEFRRVSGATIPELLRSALSMRKNEGLTRSQMLLAANAPILAKRAMNDGDPVGGYLPSGTVAGVIDDRPTCAELIERIVREAEETLARLANRNQE